jgi:hypothetical protein
MPERIRCPNCGALNAADAEWCNQCLTVFSPQEPEPEPEPEAEPARAEVAVPVAPAGSDVALASDPDTAPAAPAQPVATKTVGAFTVSDAGITWTCSVCDSVNPLDASVCGVCGALFAETVREKPEVVERDPNMAAMLSLFFPGAGHAYIGQWGQATARGIISLWALLVVTIAVFSKDQPGSKTIALIFGLVAIGLWLLAAHDAYREAKHEPQQVILKGRVFLYLVLALLTLLMGLLMATSLGQT